MNYCVSCGNPLDEGAKFCTVCGAVVGGAPKADPINSAQPSPEKESKIEDTINKFTNTADTTADFSVDDINNNRIMAILAYIGLLFLVPLIAARESAFARFHTNQGIILFLFGVIGSVLYIIPFVGWIAGGIINIISFVLFIIGLINAVKGDAKELPLIGKYRILK